MFDRRPRASTLLLGLAAIVLVGHSLLYNFVTDDAYISFVYSRNFAEHGELTFNLGDRVEGYTNFSWTVLLGLLMKLGIPPELSSRVLGTICALLTLWLVTRIMRRAVGDTGWAAVPALLLASSSGFACWTSGGLETQLFTVAVTGALESVVAATQDHRALRRSGWLLALAAMTRPEGPLIAAVLGLVWIVHAAIAWVTVHWRPSRNELIAAAWFLGLWVPWFLWRWNYYGWPFPNTYYVKADGDWSGPNMAREMVQHGYYYIWAWLAQTRLVFVLPLAALGIVAIRPNTPRFVLGLACGLLAIVYIPYTISVGGDFMGLFRFIMPLFVVAAIVVVLGLQWIAARLPHHLTMPAWIAAAVLGFAIVVCVRAIAFSVLPDLAVVRALVTILLLAAAIAFAFAWRWGQVGALAAVALLAGAAATQLDLTRRSLDPKNLAADRGVIDTPAFLIVYTEDRAKIGRAMADCFTDTDFSIVGGAGAQPYFGRMRGIDVFGLVSDRIAHQSPRTRPRAGHTKWGEPAILASYEPDFVFSCYDIHKTAAQPQLAHCAGFWKARGFELVTMHIPGMQERGEYYTFLARKARNFQCPGRVR